MQTCLVARQYERAGVELEIALRQLAHRELLGALAPRCDESGAQGRIVEERPPRGAQRGDIARRYQQRVLSGARDVLISLDRGRDDRGAGRHRLEEDDPERLTAQRRRAERRRTAQELVAGSVGHGAEPLDVADRAALELVGLLPD